MDRSEMADILEKAADLYESEQVDWCQGEWATKKGGVLSVCAEGAIYLACGVEVRWLLNNTPYTSRELMGRGDYVINHLSGVTRSRCSKRLHVWNDTDPEVTKSAVIELMKEQAKELRNGK